MRIMLRSALGSKHIQWQPLKHSAQATSQRKTANQRLISKATLRPVAQSKERVYKSLIGASRSLGNVKQYIRDTQGETMKCLEPEHPHLKKGRNLYTSGEMEEEDEELEEVDKEQRDHTYVETMISRTVSYHRRTTLERSSKMKNGDRKTYTRWGPSVEDKKVSDGIPTESTTTSSHTPINLEDLEKEAKDLDEELEKMIKKGGKHRLDLDAIEERSENGREYEKP